MNTRRRRSAGRIGPRGYPKGVQNTRYTLAKFTPTRTENLLGLQANTLKHIYRMTLRPFRFRRGANIADKSTHQHTRKPQMCGYLLKFCTRKCDFFFLANFTTNAQYFPVQKSHHRRPTKTHPQLTGLQMSEFRTSTALRTPYKLRFPFSCDLPNWQSTYIHNDLQKQTINLVL